MQRALRSLTHELGVAAPRVVRGAPLHFRHRARLAVRGRAHAPRIGLFAAGTHHVVHTPACPVHHPRINQVAAALGSAMREMRAAPYAERAHAGLVRYLQVAVNRPSGKAQVVLVCNEERPAASLPLLRRLSATLGDTLDGLFWNGHTEQNNAILGPRWQRLQGEAALVEHVAGAQVFYPPGAFGQSHLELAERIADRIHAWVPDATRVVEFYAGVGAIGLGLAGCVASLTLNEEAPGSLAGLAQGVEALPEPTRAGVQIAAGTAGAVATLAHGTSVVIVDPPRKGLDAALLEALCDQPPARLLYASCGHDAFAREARVLQARGALALAELEVYDLFPYTDHVELLARFETQRGPRLPSPTLHHDAPGT